MNWIYIVIVSAVLYGAAEIFSKYVADESSDPRVIGFFASAYAGIAAFSVAVIQGQVWAHPDAWGVVGIVVSAVMYALGTITYYQSLKHSDVSSFTLFTKTQTVFMFLGGIFLFRESLLPFQIVGAALILTGTFLLSYQRGAFRLNINARLAVLTAALFAVGALIDRAIIHQYPASLYTAINYAIDAAVLLSFATAAFGTGVRIPRLATHGLIAASSVFYSLSAIGFYLAYQARAPVGLVSVISQLQIPVVVAYGILFLRERKQLAEKIIAMVLMAVGASLLR